MTRRQLEHIIRAAAGAVNVDEIIVIGSQAILGAYPNAPSELLNSKDADVFPKDAPAMSEVIEGSLGEGSIFCDTFGYFAHGVGEETATMPDGWKDRLIRIQNENTRGAIGWCLEPHDLAVSKLIAARDKDFEYLDAMIRAKLVSLELIRDRLLITSRISSEQRTVAEARLERWRQLD